MRPLYANSTNDRGYRIQRGTCTDRDHSHSRRPGGNQTAFWSREYVSSHLCWSTWRGRLGSSREYWTCSSRWALRPKLNCGSTSGSRGQDPTKPEHTRRKDGHVSEGARPEPRGPGGGHGEESNEDDSEPIVPDTGTPPQSVTPRQFESYVSVVSEDGEKDPDGIEHSARMDLERSAIRRILDDEPELEWQETPPNNPGFDLYRGATMDTATEWCEVKAMKGTLDDRPVGISRTQFEWADKHRDKYWLYVVERAGESDPNIVRIQDPVGKAKTFTFDRGWRAVAK